MDKSDIFEICPVLLFSMTVIAIKTDSYFKVSKGLLSHFYDFCNCFGDEDIGLHSATGLLICGIWYFWYYCFLLTNFSKSDDYIRFDFIQWIRKIYGDFKNLTDSAIHWWWCQMSRVSYKINHSDFAKLIKNGLKIAIENRVSCKL